MCDVGIEFKVYKNLLICCVVEVNGYEGLEGVLIGFNVIVFSNEDVVVFVKIFNDFVKDYEVLEIKVGVIEGKVVFFEEIKVFVIFLLCEGLLFMFCNVF